MSINVIRDTMPRHKPLSLIARRFKILRKEGDTKDNLCVRIAL